VAGRAKSFVLVVCYCVPCDSTAVVAVFSTFDHGGRNHNSNNIRIALLLIVVVVIVAAMVERRRQDDLFAEAVAVRRGAIFC